VLVAVAQFACRWLEIPVDGFFFDGKWHLFAAGILVYYTINYATAVQYWWLFGLLAVCAIWCWSGYGVSYEGEAGFTLALAILLLLSWTPKFEPVHLWWKLVLILTDEEVQEYGQEGEGRKDSGGGEWARRGIQGACRIGGLQR
jgi:hypothetical protein